MKKPIFIPLSLLKESFFEIDNKSRRNIYIYLWYTLCVDLIITFGRRIFMLYPSEADIPNQFIEIALIIFLIIDFFALLILSLRCIKGMFSELLVKVFIFEFHIQTFPYIYLFLGGMSCFEVIKGQFSASTFFSILSISISVVTLWALKSIFKLRRHALNKIN